MIIPSVDPATTYKYELISEEFKQNDSILTDIKNVRQNIYDIQSRIMLSYSGANNKFQYNNEYKLIKELNTIQKTINNAFRNLVSKTHIMDDFDFIDNANILGISNSSLFLRRPSKTTYMFKKSLGYYLRAFYTIFYTKRKQFSDWAYTIKDKKQALYTMHNTLSDILMPIFDIIPNYLYITPYLHGVNAFNYSTTTDFVDYDGVLVINCTIENKTYNAAPRSLNSRYITITSWGNIYVEFTNMTVKFMDHFNKFISTDVHRYVNIAPYFLTILHELQNLHEKIVLEKQTKIELLSNRLDVLYRSKKHLDFKDAMELVRNKLLPLSIAQGL